MRRKKRGRKVPRYIHTYTVSVLLPGPARALKLPIWALRSATGGGYVTAPPPPPGIQPVTKPSQSPRVTPYEVVQSRYGQGTHFKDLLCIHRYIPLSSVLTNTHVFLNDATADTDGSGWLGFPAPYARIQAAYPMFGYAYRGGPARRHPHSACCLQSWTSLPNDGGGGHSHGCRSPEDKGQGGTLLISPPVRFVSPRHRLGAWFCGRNQGRVHERSYRLLEHGTSFRILVGSPFPQSIVTGLGRQRPAL